MVEESRGARRIIAMKRFRRIFLASLMVAALMLGLVGMHALSGGAQFTPRDATSAQVVSGIPTSSNVGTGSTVGMASVTSASPVSAGVAITPGCEGICATNCLILGMVCALSFLVALIGLLLSKLPPVPVSDLRKALRIPRIGNSKFVLPTTPSLYTLSISRT